MPNSIPHLQFSGSAKNEHADQTVRALQAWPDHASQSPRDGAADPQPRDAAGHGAQSAGDRILRPARLRRTAGERGNPGFAAGPGLSGHARHLFQGTGRGLAQGDRPRARARRPHLPSALACRTHFACRPAAEQPGAGGAVRDPRQGQDVRRRNVRRRLRAARAGAGGNPRHHRRLQARHGECAGSRLRRRRNPRRQRLSAGAVCQGRHQQAHRRLWRVDREPREADAGSVQGGRGGSRARANRHPHLAGDAGQRHLRQQSAAAVRLHRRSAQRAEARLHPRRRGRHRRPARHRAVRLRLACASDSRAPISPTTATISNWRPRCWRRTRPT